MMTKFIYIFVILHLVFVVNAEIIKENCLQGGASCFFSERCCSKMCAYKRSSKNNGRACLEEEDDFFTETTSVQIVNSRLYCLPIGSSCSSKTECCSNKCETYCKSENLFEYLLEMRDRFPGYCLTEGKKCAVNSDCCSSKCIRNSQQYRGTCDSDDRKKLPSFLNDFSIFQLELKSHICRSPGQSCLMDQDCCYRKCLRFDSKASMNPFCDIKRT